MSALADMAAALVIAGAALWGVLSGTDVFQAMLDGVAEGLRTLLRIFPSLVALLTAVYMLRASGALELLTNLLSPLLGLLGIPPETAPLMLLRPVSGSGALAAATELMAQYGPDSYIGRTAAVMLGSTGIKHTRWAVPAALCADVVGFAASAFAVRLLWGGTL